MNNRNLVNSTEKESIRFPGFMRLLRSRKRNYFLLGVAGLLVIGFLVYGLLIYGSSNSKIRYSPSDVVYGEKVIAIHMMGGVSGTVPTEQVFLDPSKEPSIQLSENFYDFGMINSNQVLTRTFIIANKGLSPLIIQQSFTTCGCTTAEFSAKEIPPGKVALMILRFDPAYHNMSGSTVRRGVIFITNDPNHPTQEIWIQVSVR